MVADARTHCLEVYNAESSNGGPAMRGSIGCHCLACPAVEPWYPLRTAGQARQWHPSIQDCQITSSISNPQRRGNWQQKEMQDDCKIGNLPLWEASLMPIVFCFDSRSASETPHTATLQSSWKEMA